MKLQTSEASKHPNFQSLCVLKIGNIWFISQNISFVCKWGEKLDRKQEFCEDFKCILFLSQIQITIRIRSFSHGISASTSAPKQEVPKCVQITSLKKIIQGTTNKEKNITVTFSPFKITWAPWEWNTRSFHRTLCFFSSKSSSVTLWKVEDIVHAGKRGSNPDLVTESGIFRKNIFHSWGRVLNS